MDAQRREDITGWEAREFDGGFDGLRRYADRGFSGAATDGAGWLFMLDGRVVGAVDADLDAFSDASGTVYEAPHEALPVLFAMQERGGEERARYYTKDTPLSEADDKLSRGGFTGYVELSENVLSGDYYVAYTAGESMAAAFVGNARRLETGEDAFALANDEVGIYTVYEVDLDVREIPTADVVDGGDAGESETDGSDDTDSVVVEGGDAGGVDAEAADAGGVDTEAADAGGVDAEAADAGGVDAEAADADGPTDGEHTLEATDDGSSPPETDHDRTTTNGRDDPPSGPASAAAGGDDGGDREGNGRRRRSDEPIADERDEGSRPALGSDGVESEGGATADRNTRETDRNATTADRNATTGRPTAREAEPSTDQRTEPSVGSNGPSDDVFSEEAQWRETKSIPALDPAETGDRGEDSSTGSPERANRQGETGSGRTDASTRTPSPAGTNEVASKESASGRGSEGTSPSPRPTERAGSGRAAVSGRAPDEVGGRIEELESALSSAESAREEMAAERDALEAERDELREELEAVTTERDELRSERDRLEDELERLRTEVDRLREKLDRAESRLPDGERSLSAGEARDGTNLFIRYDSRGGATLEDAHDGTVDREELRENLRIEHHTSFETEGLLVDGEPFESFLQGTMEYGFTRWLVEELPFEVAETGNGSALRALYDALPEVDRAEIGGSVGVAIRENGEETREQRPFDLVLRDRMGDPLFVADLNDTRAPTEGATLESLVANGGVIADSNEAFAAAFAVTASFFEPDALEAASDAVGGGLFNRSKRKSFVKLSRKRGYHLCLVESREGGFHLTVPDL